MFPGLPTAFTWLVAATSKVVFTSWKAGRVPGTRRQAAALGVRYGQTTARGFGRPRVVPRALTGVSGVRVVRYRDRQDDAQITGPSIMCPSQPMSYRNVPLFHNRSMHLSRPSFWLASTYAFKRPFLALSQHLYSGYLSTVRPRANETKQIKTQGSTLPSSLPPPPNKRVYIGL